MPCLFGSYNHAGSALVFLAECGCFGAWPRQGKYDEILAVRLRTGYTQFRSWAKSLKLEASQQPRFTPARCNRTSRLSFACLSSKAVMGKTVSFWLMHVWRERTSLPSATDLEKRVATCMWTYTEFIRLMDESPMILSDQCAREMFDKGMLHLQLYSALRFQSSRTLGAHSLNRHLWLLLPKHHHFMHLLFDVRDFKVNPRFFTLLCAESWIGSVGRMARTCHRATLSKRVLERYLVKLGMHCDNLM